MTATDKNRLLHGIVLLIFASACCIMWVMLHLLVNGLPALYRPEFTVLWANLRLVFVVLPILAACYCCLVWFWKTERPANWLGFFATAMLVLVLTILPTTVAIWLVMVQFVEQTMLK